MISSRKSTRVPVTVLLAFLVAAVPATRLQAGGAKVPNQSTRAMGMSDAFVAGADDASAVYYNPAGLSRLKGAEVITNLYVAHSTIYASGPGTDVTSDGRVYVLPNFYLGLPLDATNATTLGLGVYTPFGLGSRWGDDVARQWAQLPGTPLGATAATLSEIQLVNINPVIARKLTDGLSAGVGLDYYVSRAVSRGEMNYSPFGGPGEVDLDVEGDGVGFNGGLQWQCSKKVILGLVARSEVEVDYEGDLERDAVPAPLPGTPGVSSHAETTVDYPLSLAAGLRWLVTDRFPCLATATPAPAATNAGERLAAAGVLSFEQLRRLARLRGDA